MGETAEDDPRLQAAQYNGSINRQIRIRIKTVAGQGETTEDEPWFQANTN